MVKLTNLSVNYGENVVYDDFNCEFPSGINVVLGKSGCGKTTLLRVVAGLLPHGGRCQTDGKIAMVFQRPSLSPVSVFNNVKMVTDGTDEEVDNALQKAEIFQKRNQNARKLSGGEQQRVALARMLAAKGKILLLDEPFSNLDYGTKASLRRTFLNMVTDETVIFVTHDVEDAVAVADRIYLLDGHPCKLTLIATPSQNRASRNEFDEESNALRQKLHDLFVSND